MNLNSTFSNIFLSHSGKVSTKWESYLPLYDQIFESFRNSPVHLLEIGIQNGGSLELWEKYFKNGLKIIGCDIDLRCGSLEFPQSNIDLVIGDICDPLVTKKILEIAPKFQIIIDDGSHRSTNIISTFLTLFPHLAPGGIYVVEDLHCSYWKEYQGGLFDPHSSISFFKKLIDIVNQQYWCNQLTVEEFMKDFSTSNLLHASCWDALREIDSIEFVNSVCILKKKSSPDDGLGRLLVSGQEEKVSPIKEGLNVNKNIPQFPQLDNPFSSQQVHLAAQSIERDALVRKHLEALVAKNHELTQLYYDASLKVIELEAQLKDLDNGESIFK
jgi:hypothetical protein